MRRCLSKANKLRYIYTIRGTLRDIAIKEREINNIKIKIIPFIIYFIKLHIFEISHFSRFLKTISKSAVAQAKMVECILFDLNMVGKTQWSLISPFCYDKYSTTAAYFRFQCESYRNQFEGVLYLFAISNGE